MQPMSMGRIAEIVGGRLGRAPDPDIAVADPPVIDSRATRPAALFPAFDGERADRHDFAASAIVAGVRARASRSTVNCCGPTGREPFEVGGGSANGELEWDYPVHGELMDPFPPLSELCRFVGLGQVDHAASRASS